MKIAITGGTGFVGSHFARKLSESGHEVVLISRGVDHRNESIRDLPRTTFAPVGLDDEEKLAAAFAGCHAVAHCAGINRESGRQTYQRVHVDGTKHVITAARKAGVKKILLLSFLRARPNCSSAYHESKWAAEEIVRGSGLDYTVIKAGVIYGRGDHMLDHLSHALHTFPVFALIGLREQPVGPTVIDDMIRVIYAALVEDRLSRQTVAVTGPEEMALGETVKRVARVLGKKPFFIRMPLWFHYVLGWFCERIMTIPLVSIAQVRILSEGVVEPYRPCEELPADLLPRTGFTDDKIRNGLPPAKPFGLGDFLLFQKKADKS